MPLPLLDSVRQISQAVAEQAVWVRIDRAALAEYSAELPADRLVLPEMDPDIHYLRHGWETVAYFLTLDAVNFGSGYFPEIIGPRPSGFRTVAAALTGHFAAHGPIAPERLRLLDAAACAGIFRLDPRQAACFELMGLFARALNDLGAFIGERFQGDFLRVIDSAGGCAQHLVELLTTMPLFDDSALYRGMSVPFHKRAQLTAADLFIAFAGEGPGRFTDIDRLTICADNLVPHVLRLDGVLHYREDLAARIDAGQALAAGSPEEVEIRACAVHAGELIVAQLRRDGHDVSAMMLDNYLWHRGQEPLYRARPRHRTRTVFY